MTAPSVGDMALRQVIDDMRFGKHPAPKWEVDKQYWVLRTIIDYMRPSPELQSEAWAEFKALNGEAPVKPYERRDRVVAG